MEQSEIYQYYKSQKRCVRCHQQDAFTLNGRSYCAECAEKDREYSKIRYQRGKERHKATDRQRASDRKQSGMCYRCGKRPPRDGIGMCEACAARKREIRRRNRPADALTIADLKERSDNGFCYHCGAPVKDGLTLAFQPYRICERCWQNIKAAGDMGRIREREIYDMRGFWLVGYPTPKRANDGQERENP